MIETTEATATPRATSNHFGNHLRAIRHGLQLSQAEFAALLRKAGEEIGDPNACTKRLVQKWEQGDHYGCRPNYCRALLHLTGINFAQVREPSHDLSAQQSRAGGDGVTLALIDHIMVELAQVREQIGQKANSAAT